MHRSSPARAVFGLLAAGALVATGATLRCPARDGRAEARAFLRSYRAAPTGTASPYPAGHDIAKGVFVNPSAESPSEVARAARAFAASAGWTLSSPAKDASFVNAGTLPDRDAFRRLGFGRFSRTAFMALTLRPRPGGGCEIVILSSGGPIVL